MKHYYVSVEDKVEDAQELVEGLGGLVLRRYELPKARLYAALDDDAAAKLVEKGYKVEEAPVGTVTILGGIRIPESSQSLK